MLDNTFVYSGDTPSVVDNMVFLNFTLGSAVVDMQCIVFNQDVIEANCEFIL